MNNRSSFTLIELLVVIAILAILSVAVVFIINPADIIKQSRDTNRLTDLNNLNKALAVFDVTNPNDFTGTSSIVYVSLPDSTTTCANLSLPALPAGYTYNCVTSSTLTQADGTGWIPVNFTNVSYGSPVQRLPIDPINSSTTGQYYTYIMGGSWALSARAESAKYSPKAFNDNGYDPDRMEVGSNLVLYQPATTLLAHYFAQPGSGTTAIDYSGNSRSGVITAGAGGWTTDNKGNTTRAYDFDGANTTIPTTLTSNADFLNGFTISAWIKPRTNGEGNAGAIVDKTGGISTVGEDGFSMRIIGGRIWFYVGSVSNWKQTSVIPFNEFSFVTVTLSSSSVLTIYINRVDATVGGAGTIDIANITNTQPFTIGNISNSLVRTFDGGISDVRIYNRVLSAAEVQAIYNSTR